jgi:hypothetical protein
MKIEKLTNADIIGKINEIIDVVNHMRAVLDSVVDLVNVHEREGDKTQMQVEELREMLTDPKYWKDQDPDFVKKVADKFNKLYGDDK